ncbi:MAG: hypothetical protein GWN55_04275 [Phycisphaerae bacterium]|nr:hypothetical protein [Gammaproteobacteria bacterium]NIR25572.1 hypothetical protein [Gammaproteobacteria bacterium]NIS54671.1 hypothetical protein [Phycisphaerae bacterium]NIV00536.1 hypothetical protein [Phycisphaerae bacterium]NIW97876.1 hypothetical protein [Phycisphaerae bacterium]
MLEMLILMLVSLGVIPWNSEQIASVNNFIVAFVALAALVVPMYLARRVVTPVSDPRLADGQPAQLVKKEYED